MSYGVLILSHGRADNLITARTLIAKGYRGEWKVLIDDEDEQGDRYRELYGDHVIEFCKQDYIDVTQTNAPSSDRPRGVVVYARNAAPDIATSLGWDYFIELDDDYAGVDIRYNEHGKLAASNIHDYDALFEAMVRFVDSTGVDALAIAQGGDFIGGVESTAARCGWLRKVMNFYCFPSGSTVRFTGYINEDLTTSVLEGSRGRVFLTYCGCNVYQTVTQKAAGGLTEEYLRHGTYAKSMCSVITCPSCVSVSSMGVTDCRIHHSVKWRYAVPKIIREA